MTTAPRTSTVTLAWRPSALAGQLVAVSALALAAAILTHRPELVAVAAPLLGPVALTRLWHRGHRGGRLELTTDTSGLRCFEGDEVRIDVVARVRPGCEGLRLALAAPPDAPVLDHRHTETGDRVDAHWVLRTDRWGRSAVTVTATARSGAGLLEAVATAEVGELRVHPRPEHQPASLRSERLPDRIGTHVTRRRGEGIEFGAIRPFVPGDALRSVNWAATARTGKLQVTERLTERAADVVCLIDTYTERGPTAELPATRDAVDLAVHGAAQLAQAALRRGDRAGVVALGTTLRWLGVELGRKQFYRIVDTVLDGWRSDGDRPQHTDLVPRGALPPQSVVVAFTPLLDGRIVLGLDDLRLRGHTVVVVDVLRDLPCAEHVTVDPLVARVWRLERGRLHRRLALLGIPVAPWPRGRDLGAVLEPIGGALRPRAGVRR